VLIVCLVFCVVFLGGVCVDRMFGFLCCVFGGACIDRMFSFLF
jgi:hypothetical protein